MNSKQLEQVLESPITKAAKGRFMSIEELEQIKTILEAWEIVKDIIEIKRGEIFDPVLRIKQGKGGLTHEKFRVLKNLIRVGDK